MEPAPWAIVVPGHSVSGRLSARCRRLLTAAARLADLREPRVVVFTGWSPAGGPSEAEQMLEAWPGRRDVDLVAETTATVTAENAARSLPLLLARGVREATVVCTPLHLGRVRYLFPAVYARYGVRCRITVAWTAPTPSALAWELGALALLRRQRRAALDELRAGLDG